MFLATKTNLILLALIFSVFPLLRIFEFSFENVFKSKKNTKKKLVLKTFTNTVCEIPFYLFCLLVGDLFVLSNVNNCNFKKSLFKRFKHFMHVNSIRNIPN